VKGVYYYKKRGDWRAVLHIDGEKKHLGYYLDFENAVLARFTYEQKHNTNGCYNDSPAERYLERITAV
jgi:hypothetical protein